MFVKLFYTLRTYGVPVSTRELLDLNAALDKGLMRQPHPDFPEDKELWYFASRDDMYRLIKLCMVKDERHFDKFDRAMADYFDGVDSLDIDELMSKLTDIPKEWLDLKLDPKNLTEEQRRLLKKYGSLEELMKALEERLKEQKKRHQGGSKWVGTWGSSPFGAYGDHPEGVRVGGESRKRSAVKVWEQRKYRDLDDDKQLGTRQLQMALRNLRQFARTGSADELDIKETIKRTAQKGVLDIHMQPERRNRVKVLMLFDVGGSMDMHIEALEKLFSAAKNEFKTLEFYYFHNCLYDYVWKNNQRRHAERTPTMELLQKYGREYRVIFVGDASMSPYELFSVGGSVEYMNAEAGVVWLKRMLAHFDKVAWLNPEDQAYWQYTHTIGEIQKLMEGHMYPMTLHGVEEMTAYLAR
ncbi:vWA domain-containing protein [Psychrobacter sanguinis]|uniref:vWA domain-containing protein n=1 Tax=Psychrobacter sanguinis TaxID=861445 RepID=UPI00020C7ECF|nr:VWA domain-containing protein [Psychrobacter sanguinis]EGK10073.1 VWA containing CoxE family protein [Psychrobacter sp. 1501(2011)]MCD9152524.1 VWA domain-containing protein [Psychrobacter sanguinis]